MNPEKAPILLFPTHFLGNFVLGLPWVLKVLESHPDALVVLDVRFGPLAAMVLPPQTRTLLFPRSEMAKDKPFFSRLSHYWRFMRAFRGARTDTILDLEGERFTGVLARLSGCNNRVGHTGKRAELFYTDIRDPNYKNHRFKAFGEIVSEYVDEVAPSSSLPYRIGASAGETIEKLVTAAAGKNLVAVHPGASVSYKLWPGEYFAELVTLLHEAGLQVVWVGAGENDAEIIDAVTAQLGGIEVFNFCNRLSFAELAELYRRCRFFVGGDSGPMHLAASTGIPVFALFGPSDEAIWAPLGENSYMVRGSEACGEDCDTFRCSFNYRCMTSLRPQSVMAVINDKILGHDTAQAVED
ncbi:MAG: glycosyltransferase family 9 protein [Pseudomonadales bacterium]|nr:glycosyltransferase family 9 protein [Pseudomonadales bacterium]